MLQIRGIVKAAQTARHRLDCGISSNSVAAFKAFVTDSIETIERSCIQARVAPEQLPSKSRSAYSFLKSIDLDNLPVVDNRANSQKELTLCLKNIRGQQRTILQQISGLAASPTPDAALHQKLTKTLTRVVTEIEKICSQQQATPANLSRSSRSIYAWMKFLTDESYLQLHLKTTDCARHIAQTIGQRHCQELEVVVEVTHLAALYKSRRQGSAVSILISEGFINANSEVLTALITAALLGKSRDTTRIIRNFASSEEYSEVLLELDLIAQANVNQSQGKCYDLEELFNKVNREYFGSTLVKPSLCWSQIHTYRKFGHYEPATDRVVISLTLDDARIPKFVAEFVLYHELLHKYHGAKWIDGRRMVHTKQFRQDEQQFKLYKEANVWLRKLAASQSDIFKVPVLSDGGEFR